MQKEGRSVSSVGASAEDMEGNWLGQIVLEVAAIAPGSFDEDTVAAAQAFKAKGGMTAKLEASRVEALGNPVNQRLPDSFESVCRRYMRKSSWSASEAAHLMLGYLPDRPWLGSDADFEIKELEQDIFDSEGVSFWPVKTGFTRAGKRFSQKDLVKWGASVGLCLPYPLSEAVTEKKKPRVDPRSENKKKAAEYAAEVWADEIYRGKEPKSLTAMVGLIRRKTTFGDNVADDTIKGWIRDHHPNREDRKRMHKENSSS